MPQYLISVHHDDSARERTPEQMLPIHAAVSRLNEEAMADGSFVFAGGLHAPDATTVVDPRSGTPVLSDGPFIETKEYMGGFWVVEKADLDDALAWAKRASLACQDVLEVRPFMEESPEAAAA